MEDREKILRRFAADTGNQLTAHWAVTEIDRLREELAEAVRLMNDSERRAIAAEVLLRKISRAHPDETVAEFQHDIDDLQRISLGLHEEIDELGKDKARVVELEAENKIVHADLQRISLELHEEIDELEKDKAPGVKLKNGVYAEFERGWYHIRSDEYERQLGELDAAKKDEARVVELEAENKIVHADLQRISLELHEEIDELTRFREDLEDWEDSAKRAAGEDCLRHEKHCTCVPLLRKVLKDAEARVVELEGDLQAENTARFDLEMQIQESEKDRALLINFIHVIKEWDQDDTVQTLLAAPDFIDVVQMLGDGRDAIDAEKGGE
jgi:gamma-glutamylcyclotransferase (GGCT)/AIG2-like uncharacterized protein YtfP